MMNSSIPTDDGGEDDHSTSQARFREIGFPAVAAALCCAQMPAPADEQKDKHVHDDATAGEPGDYWSEEEQPWFGVP
jgi:hypothetical protein